MAGAFVDLEKDYNMVWRSGPLVKNYKARLYRFIERFISSR